MQALRWLGFALGLAVLLGTSLSVLHTVAGPRGRNSRLASYIGRSIEGFGRLVARRMSKQGTRDRVLVLVGPAAFLAVLLAWLVCYALGFALLYWPLLRGLGRAFALAGSSVFAPGFVLPDGTVPTVLSFLAATAGLIVVTLELAYLPSLYAAYNRREIAVTLLTARCEGIVTGEHLLLTHLRQNWSDGLTALYAAWEQWSADVRETHTNYPILISFRASDPTVPWPYALMAVLDAAALQAVLLPDTRSPQALATLRIGTQTLRSITSWVEVEELPESTVIDLPAVARELRELGFDPPEDLEIAAKQLHAFRGRYLPPLRALSAHLLLATDLHEDLNVID